MSEDSKHAMDTLTDPELTTAMQQVFKRCQTDMEFRKLCLSDPVAALEEVCGRRLKGLTIRFVERKETPDPPLSK
jgi:hypothetical protein